MKSRSITASVAAVVAGLAISGCAQIPTSGGSASIDGVRTPAPGEIDAYVSDKPAELREHYRALFEGGVRNAVLNHMRIGLAAMELGHFDHAEAAFDGALMRIERVYAKDRKADLAKSKFQKENIKDFKGEPYERAMAYLYRGLLYLREGDYENARATFLSGEFQDTVAEGEEFRGDFAVLNYLAGWASHCEGDTGRADTFFKLAKTHNPSLSSPARNDNVLFVADLGTAPVKIGKGKHKEALGFVRGTGFIESSVSFVSPQLGTIKAKPATSVSHQAMTRGGRPVEFILDGKAKFKETTAAASEISGAIAEQAIVQGAFYGNSDMMNAGTAIAAAGLVLDLFSSATKAEADTRYWDNLPDSISVGTASSDGSLGSVQAVFSGKGRSFTRPALMSSQGSFCSIVWSRSRNATDIPAVAPGSELTQRQKRKLRKTLRRQEQAFRAELHAANRG